MNNKVIKLHKILYPEEYATIFIFTYPSFNFELQELIGKSGYVEIFKTKYHKSLRFLEQLKKNCVFQEKIFEQLLNADFGKGRGKNPFCRRTFRQRYARKESDDFAFGSYYS